MSGGDSRALPPPLPPLRATQPPLAPQAAGKLGYFYPVGIGLYYYSVADTSNTSDTS